MPLKGFSRSRSTLEESLALSSRKLFLFIILFGGGLSGSLKCAKSAEISLLENCMLRDFFALLVIVFLSALLSPVFLLRYELDIAWLYY